MGSIFSRLFNSKPKDLPELIERHYEDDIKKATKHSDDMMMQTLLITRQIGETTQILKGIYSDVHRQLGYSKAQYEQLVDAICSRIVSKYFPDDQYSNRDTENNPADWAE